MRHRMKQPGWWEKWDFYAILFQRGGLDIWTVSEAIPNDRRSLGQAAHLAKIHALGGQRWAIVNRDCQRIENLDAYNPKVCGTGKRVTRLAPELRTLKAKTV